MPLTGRRGRSGHIDGESEPSAPTRASWGHPDVRRGGRVDTLLDTFDETVDARSLRSDGRRPVVHPRSLFRRAGSDYRNDPDWFGDGINCRVPPLRRRQSRRPRGNGEARVIPVDVRAQRRRGGGAIDKPVPPSHAPLKRLLPPCLAAVRARPRSKPGVGPSGFELHSRRGCAYSSRDGSPVLRGAANTHATHLSQVEGKPGQTHLSSQSIDKNRAPVVNQPEIPTGAFFITPITNSI